MVALLVPWSCNKAQLKGFIRLPLIKKKKKKKNFSDTPMNTSSTGLKMGRIC